MKQNIVHPDIYINFTYGNSSGIGLFQKAAITIFSQAGPYFIQQNLVYVWVFAKNITSTIY